MPLVAAQQLQQPQQPQQLQQLLSVAAPLGKGCTCTCCCCCCCCNGSADGAAHEQLWASNAAREGNIRGCKAYVLLLLLLQLLLSVALVLLLLLAFGVSCSCSVFCCCCCCRCFLSCCSEAVSVSGLATPPPSTFSCCHCPLHTSSPLLLLLLLLLSGCIDSRSSHTSVRGLPSAPTPPKIKKLQPPPHRRKAVIECLRSSSSSSSSRSSRDGRLNAQRNAGTPKAPDEQQIAAATQSGSSNSCYPFRK